VQLLRVTPEVRLEVKQRGTATELLEHESPVIEEAGHQRGVPERCADLRVTFGHTAGLEQLVVRDHRELSHALRLRQEIAHVLAGWTRIALPAAPPGAAGRRVGAADRARRASRAAA